jgi:uncharacterized membrane protein
VLVIDGSNLMVQRRSIQNAANAAVLAVAQSIETTRDATCLANARVYSKLNGVDVISGPATPNGEQQAKQDRSDDDQDHVGHGLDTATLGPWRQSRATSR